MEKDEKIKNNNIAPVSGDCHVHMILDGVDWRAAIDAHKGNGPQDEIIKSRFKLYKDAGIAFLRDGGDAFNVSLRAKDLAPEFEIDYRTPAFPICKKGHYGNFFCRDYETLDDFRKLVLEAKDLGADFIKIMISGIMDFDNYGRLLDGAFSVEDARNAESDDEGLLGSDEIASLIDIAHSEGFAVMAHCNGAAAISAALDAGVDSLEHGAYMDDECLFRLAESDTVWIPTVAPVADLIGKPGYNDAVLKEIVKTQISNIHTAWFRGAMIGLGTDAGAHAVTHPSVSAEYAFLKAAIDDLEFDAHIRASLAQIEWKFKRY